MKKFKVEITEKLVKTVWVETKDKDEESVNELIEEMIADEKIVLTADDFESRDIVVKEIINEQ